MKILEVVPGIFRGPRLINTGDFQDLRTLGIKTILNLEGGIIEAITSTNSEEVGAYYSGIQTIRIEMNAIFPPSIRDLDFCDTILGHPDRFPIYVHCAQGVDRTGFVIAYYRIRSCGWSVERAIDEMKILGFHWWYWYWIPSLRRLK